MVNDQYDDLKMTKAVIFFSIAEIGQIYLYGSER